MHSRLTAMHNYRNARAVSHARARAISGERLSARPDCLLGARPIRRQTTRRLYFYAFPSPPLEKGNWKESSPAAARMSETIKPAAMLRVRRVSVMRPVRERKIGFTRESTRRILRDCGDLSRALASPLNGTTMFRDYN